MTRLAFPLTVVVLTVTTTVACAVVLNVGGQVSAPATPRAPSVAMTLPADPITTRVSVDPPTLERASRSVRLQPAPSRAPGRPPVTQHPPVRARHLAARAGGRYAMWDRLVACEAPDRGWRYGAPGVGIDAGYHFYGGPNFMQATWESYGGLAFAYRAYDATREQQITVAERVLADQGVNAWPRCGPKIGLHR